MTAIFPVRGGRVPVALLLALLVVLAGCTGGADDTGATTQSTTAAGGDGAATTSGSDDGGDGSDGSSGDGSSGDGARGDGDAGDGGASDGGSAAFDEAAWDSYSGNLQSYDSYTVRFTLSSSEADTGMGVMESVVMVEGDAVSQHMTIEGEGDDFEFAHYRPASGDVGYTRYATPDGAFYQSFPIEDAPVSTFDDPLRGDVSVSAGGPQGGSQVDASVGAVPEFRDEGIVDTAEGPRHRYVIDDVSQLPADARADFDGELTDVYLELLVDDERGLPTNYVYRATVDPSGSAGPQTVEMTLTYSDFGATTVAEPDWLDEAESSGSGYGGYSG